MRSWVLLLFFFTVVMAVAHAERIPKGGKRPNDKLEEKTKRDRKDRDGQKVSNGEKRPNDRLEKKPKRDRKDRNKPIKKKNEKTKKGLESKEKKHKKGFKSKGTKHKKGLKSNDRKSKKKDEKAKKGLQSKESQKKKNKSKDRKSKNGLKSKNENKRGERKGLTVDKPKQKSTVKGPRKEKKPTNGSSKGRKSEKNKHTNVIKGNPKHRPQGKTLKRKGDRKDEKIKNSIGKKVPKKCPGTCVEDREECQGRLKGRKGCSGGDLCCIQGKARITEVRKPCKALKLCNKKKGECRKKKAGCNDGEKMYKNSKKKSYCDKKSCICCVAKCLTKKKCSNLDGKCQMKKDPCDGTFVKDKKYCKSKKCGCCIPGGFNPCKTKKICSNADGTCQPLTEACAGELKEKNDKGKKYCKGKSCGCCLPSSSTNQPDPVVPSGSTDQTGPIGIPGENAADSVVACLSVCPEKPSGEDCTTVMYGCCPKYICGNLARNCTGEDGKVYAIGENWEPTKCSRCSCLYDGTEANEECFPISWCPKSPHKDCVSLGIPKDKCCEEFSCQGTTCKSDGKYYAIGDKWTPIRNPCDACKCLKEGDNPPNIVCETTQCPSPPQPSCRPITTVRQCCAQEWDCTNEYLITMPKKWIMGQKVPVCVFTTSLSSSLSLTFVLKDKAQVFAKTVLQYIGLSDEFTCIELKVPNKIPNRATLTISGSVNKANISETMNILLVSVAKTFVQTDKFLYLPGQAVQFRILTIIGTQGLVSYEKIEEVWILSPSGSRLAQWTDLDNPQGVLQLEFPLAEVVEEGAYKIEVKVAGVDQVTQLFKVKEFVLPRFTITIEAPEVVLVTITEIPIKVCAEYTYGQATIGSATITLQLKSSWEEDYKFVIVSNSDVRGCWEANINVADLATDRYVDSLKATASFTEEGTNIEVNATTVIRIIRNPLVIEGLSKEQYHRPGLPYPFKVKVTKPDKSSVKGQVMSVCVEKTCKNYTLEESGLIHTFIPPYLMGIKRASISVKPVNVPKESGAFGSLYSSSYYDRPSSYYSPSSSSLHLVMPSEPLDCRLKDGKLTVPLLFVANDTSKTLLWTQVISRGQVIWTNLQEHDFVASDLPIDVSKLFEPMQDLNPVMVRGSLDIEIPLKEIVLTNINVLVWYMRQDGEVVSTSGEADVIQCLGNPTTLTWTTSQTPPAPKGSATLTISSTPNSICGLGVVDRSVEILTRDQSSRLTMHSVINILNRATVGTFENSQIDDYEYCSGNEIGGYYFAPIGGERLFPFYYGYSNGYVDGIQAFNDAGMLVITDLTLETRPCRVPDYQNGEVGIAPQPVDTAPGAATQMPAGNAPDSGENTSFINEEEKARTYFPETWLWNLVVLSENGESSQEVQLPDTITEWVGEAVCVHPEEGLGLSLQSTITTFTPFFLDLTLPPSARRGENVPVLVSVFNYLDQKLPVRVILLESTNYTSGSFVSDACVDVKDKSVVEFIVTPSEVGDVNLTFSATINKDDTQCSGSVAVDKSDTLIRPLRVKFEGVMEETTQSDYICSGDSAQTWSVATPSGIVEDSERIFISFSADLLGPTLENLGRLIRMPYGCGEQNMLNFAPNIFILQYLEASGQTTTEVELKAKGYMISGYQRELLYQHDDGSFSAFGNRDKEGSTLLTAFVLKSFAQAAKYIMVDEKDLNISTSWLLSLQEKESGCFALKGRVTHKMLKGGLDGESLVPLTAYVMISLLESDKLNSTAPISAATSCITASTMAEPYTNALKAYALALASDAGATALIDSVYSALTSDTTTIQKPILVETAGYTLLAMMKADKTAYVGQAATLAKLINSQRNGQGGFVTTQDTVVALQALATFSENFPASSANLNLAVSAGTQSLPFSVTQENRLILQTEYITETPPYDVTITNSGEGCAVVMLVQRYNVPEVAESTAFSMTVTSNKKSCMTSVLQMCASYLLQDGGSNMAVFEVELETGYFAVTSDLQDLVKLQTIKRQEEEDGIIFLYLDEVTSTELCLSFNVTRETKVENALPGTVTLYDYYQPQLRITKKFQIGREGC